MSTSFSASESSNEDMTSKRSFSVTLLCTEKRCYSIYPHIIISNRYILCLSLKQCYHLCHARNVLICPCIVFLSLIDVFNMSLSAYITPFVDIKPKPFHVTQKIPRISILTFNLSLLRLTPHPKDQKPFAVYTLR